LSWLYEPSSGDHDLDEDDVRVRPNPKGNRPRTKNRPDHKDAPIGMVTQVDLGRYQLHLADTRDITATLAKELRKDGVVVGDRVALAGDTSDTVGALARIVRVEPRNSLLRRSADDSDQVERVIVANATQMAIVVAAANPEPRTRLVDRYLAAAFDAGLQPILVITKCDLAEPDEFLSNFGALSIPVVKNRKDAPALEQLHELLRGETSLGGLLAARGVPAVPSPAELPAKADPYFNGAFDIAAHGSRDGGRLDAAQFEVPGPQRDTPEHRAATAKAVAEALEVYFERHFGTKLR